MPKWKRFVLASRRPAFFSIGEELFDSQEHPGRINYSVVEYISLKSALADYNQMKNVVHAAMWVPKLSTQLKLVRFYFNLNPLFRPTLYQSSHIFTQELPNCCSPRAGVGSNPGLGKIFLLNLLYFFMIIIGVRVLGTHRLEILTMPLLSIAKNDN